MELINSKGKFTLFSQGELDIDKELPKYKRIKDFLDKKNDGKDNDSPLGYGDWKGCKEKCTSLQDVVSLRDALNPNDPVAIEIGDMSKEDMEKCISDDDAFDFNNHFAQILMSPINGSFNRLHVEYLNIIENTTGGAFDTPVCSSGGGYMGFLDKMKFLFGKKQETKKDDNKTTAMVNSLISFMDTIHIEVGKGKQVHNKLDALFSMIDNALKMHQDEQVEKLACTVIVNIYECILSTHGYNRYLTIEDIEKIDCPGKRMIDIDYVSNFGRPIPEEIVEKKLRCDEFGIFDNYCIMYYDPSGKTYKVPEKTKRDPILFGLIANSDKLYYIGDWEDENCDLTIDKIAELTTVKKLEN